MTYLDDLYSKVQMATLHAFLTRTQYSETSITGLSKIFLFVWYTSYWIAFNAFGTEKTTCQKIESRFGTQESKN